MITLRLVLDTNEYEKGVKVTDAQMEELRICRHKIHHDWDYTLKPRVQKPPL